MGNFDTCSQLYQHFTCRFCTNIILLIKLHSQTASIEKLCKTLLYEKAVHNMLAKLTPVVNFINILQAAFVPIFLRQKLQSQTVFREKLKKHFCTKNASVKCC